MAGKAESSTLRVRVIQAPGRGECSQTGFAERRFSFGAGDAPGAGDTDLVLLDTRNLSPGGLAAAFAHLRELRDRRRFRRAFMICPAPTLPVTVDAIRAGIVDILPLAPGPMRLLRMLREALPPETRTRGTMRALLTSMRGLVLWSPGAASAASAASAAARESARLEQRRETAAREERRLEALRDGLATREARLTDWQRRLELDEARLEAAREKESSYEPTTPIAPEPNPIWEAHARHLEELTKELERRAAALDVREAMLKEFDTLLSQSQPPFPTADRRR